MTEMYMKLVVKISKELRETEGTYRYHFPEFRNESFRFFNYLYAQVDYKPWTPNDHNFLSFGLRRINKI